MHPKGIDFHDYNLAQWCKGQGQFPWDVVPFMSLTLKDGYNSMGKYQERHQ
jgi:hypothetical protein